MNYKTSILVTCVILCMDSDAQVAFHTYMGYTQRCAYIGTIEEYTAVQVFQDSSFVLTRYSSDYRDSYGSIARERVMGRFRQSRDTVYLRNDSSDFSVKYKFTAIAERTLVNERRVFSDLELVFVIHPTTLRRVGSFVPVLHLVNTAEFFAKETEFYSRIEHPIRYKNPRADLGASSQQGFGASRGVQASPVK